MTRGSLEALRGLNRKTVTILGTEQEVIIRHITAREFLEYGVIPSWPENENDRAEFLKSEEGQRQLWELNKFYLRQGVAEPRCSVVDNPADCPEGEWHYSNLKDDQRNALIQAIMDLRGEGAGEIVPANFPAADAGDAGSAGAPVSGAPAHAPESGAA